MPAGMEQAEPLPEPLFTPTTKADSGHDLPMSDEEAIAAVGADTFGRLRDVALAIYARGAEHSESRGIILSDTKFEFGTTPDGELLLIDEVLTPDSSRYWPKEEYRTGGSPPSFDKQYVRDHYLTLDWDRTPPAPPVPADVIAGTRERYVEAYERLTGKSFADWYGG
jgi:phosphoribosylaminoimidazole-succinocarboxamide synthase